MKKLICVLLAVVCCLGFASCAKDNGVPDGYQLISDDKVAYCFYAPTQWTKNNVGGAYSVYYSTADPSVVMVTFYTPSSDEATLDDFWATVESQYKHQYTNYELVSDEMTMLGDRNARAFTFTAGISGSDYKILQIVTGYGDYYYTMTYMSTPEKFDSHLEAVKGMASVFKFK